MGKLSRDKGKRGEREVVELLKLYGFEARRGQQFKGTSDSPDVVHNCTPLYIESKRREAFNLYAAMAKADDEKSPEQSSAVFHRRDNQRWLVTMDAGEFLELMRNLRDGT